MYVILIVNTLRKGEYSYNNNNNNNNNNENLFFVLELADRIWARAEQNWSVLPFGLGLNRTEVYYHLG
jgi:hypothetical protein